MLNNTAAKTLFSSVAWWESNYNESDQCIDFLIEFFPAPCIPCHGNESDDDWDYLDDIQAIDDVTGERGVRVIPTLS